MVTRRPSASTCSTTGCQAGAKAGKDAVSTRASQSWTERKRSKEACVTCVASGMCCMSVAAPQRKSEVRRGGAKRVLRNHGPCTRETG